MSRWRHNSLVLYIKVVDHADDVHQGEISEVERLHFEEREQVWNNWKRRLIKMRSYLFLVEVLQAEKITNVVYLITWRNFEFFFLLFWAICFLSTTKRPEWFLLCRRRWDLIGWLIFLNLILRCLSFLRQITPYPLIKLHLTQKPGHEQYHIVVFCPQERKNYLPMIHSRLLLCYLTPIHQII